MKSLLDKDFVYVPAKDQGPRYMEKRMQEYRERVKAEAKEQAEKVSTIKPKIRSKA